MLLNTDQEMIFLGEENRTSKNDNEFTLISLADPVNFENYQFFKRDDINVVGIKKGDSVLPTFGLSKRGFNNSIDLKRIDLVKK